MTRVTDPNGDGNRRQFVRLLNRYERIIDISQQLNSTLDHGQLLRKIIFAATELTNAEASSILLIDPTTGELRFEYASNLKPNEMEKIVVPMEGSIAGWVVSHGESRVIQDVTLEPQFFKNVDDTLAFRTRNLLAVPMRVHDKVIGALEAVNKRDGERFDDDDIKTLLTLASQAAIAIENSRLFQQSDFMSELVHELRTPLAAIKTSTSLLLRPELPEDRRREMITTMQSETDRLIRMTTEFLDLARWESGRARLEMAPFEVRKMLEECVDIVTPQAEERGISLSLQSPEITVNGDRGKLKQVLLNLLTNAVKYNRDYGTVTLRAHKTTALGYTYVEIEVADTGYGIAPEAQEHLFQKFYRVPDTAGTVPGSGLGLAIAKHIVEAHSGEIWLESEKDVGSTFHVTLPTTE
jgi:signal transduction histidine kinase